MAAVQPEPWPRALITNNTNHGPGIDSTSNRNKYQEYFLGVNAAGAYG
jgi:hypothetical protein